MRARMVRPAHRLAFPLFVLAGLVLGCGGGGDSPSDPGGGENHVRIVSLQPADGSYGLSGTVEVRVEFEEPVLEVGAILVPSLRGLGGDGGYLQWLVRSDDMRTFTRSVDLEPNTAYQLLVVWALGADSTGLEEPRIIQFSTTAEEPSGTIEGHIDTPHSYDPEGSILILVDAYHWIGWTNQEFQEYIMALGWVDHPGGDYRIEHLAPGQYYLFAFRNVTENGSYNEGKSLFGFYRESTLGPLKAINVRNDAVADSVNFLMSPGQNFFDDK